MSETISALVLPFLTDGRTVGELSAEELTSENYGQLLSVMPDMSVVSAYFAGRGFEVNPAELCLEITADAALFKQIWSVEFSVESNSTEPEDSGLPEITLSVPSELKVIVAKIVLPEQPMFFD